MAEWESWRAASLDVGELNIAGCDGDDDDNGFDGCEAVEGCESMRA